MSPPPPPSGRTIARRRAALALAALVAFGLGALLAGRDDGPRGGAEPADRTTAAREREERKRSGAGGAEATSSEPDGAEADGAGSARAAVDRLTMAQQVGQLLVLRFAGLTPPAYVREALRERRAAGAILFGDNVESPGQLRDLTRALRRAGGDPLVCADQEGGAIRILPWAPPAAPAPAQAAGGSVRADARAAARALHAAGVTVALAPVADVPAAGTALAGRGFAAQPAAAATHTAAAVRGWRAGGVAPTAKHFPGLGGAAVNTDDGPATIAGRGEPAPFAAAIRAGVPVVMVGHARYPGLDAAHVASQSPAVIGGLLRRRLGFRGVVVTDSMEAAASLATGSVAAASERAVRAGADLLLLTGAGSYTPVRRRLLAAARRSPALRARVRAAAARVLALRADPARAPR